METIKTAGIGGIWTKVILTINGKEYRKTIAPSGSAQYASLTGDRANSIKSGSKTALMIDKMIDAWKDVK